MALTIKAVLIILLQSLIISGVYALTLWKFHQHYKPPTWVPYDLAVVVISVALFAGIAVIKAFIYSCFPREINWRVSVIVYLVFCALPCKVLLIYSHLKPDKEVKNSQTLLLIAFQAIVGGLVFTEWIAKFRKERLTYHLLEEATIDFFFAYDVLDFYNIYFQDTSGNLQDTWLIVTVGFALLAMGKYIPARPVNMEDPSCYGPACRYVLFGMCLNDIPFVIIRLVDIGLYGLEAVDVIRPLKNLGLIIFGAMQLKLLQINKKDSSRKRLPRQPNMLNPI